MEIATLSTIASVAAIGATVIGTGIQVAGSIYAGKQAKEAAYKQALLEEGAGRAEFAASQRDALERKLEGELTMSRQQAVAAASGGGAGADAPTIVKIMSDTAARSDYARRSVLYGGEERRSTLYKSAEARRKTGQNSFLGSLFTAGGQLASGIGSVGNMVAA